MPDNTPEKTAAQLKREQREALRENYAAAIKAMKQSPAALNKGASRGGREGRGMG